MGVTVVFSVWFELGDCGVMCIVSCFLEHGLHGAEWSKVKHCSANCCSLENKENL